MTWEGLEKRKFPRISIPCKIVISFPQERTIITHTENIGCGGVRVIVEEKMALSSIVGLEIFIQPHAPVCCKGKVVWLLATKNPLTKDELMYDIGLEFMDMTGTDKERVSEVVEALMRSRIND